jgi:hypothetical protein
LNAESGGEVGGQQYLGLGSSQLGGGPADEDDIKALLGQLLGELLADAIRGTLPGEGVRRKGRPSP